MLNQFNNIKTTAMLLLVFVATVAFCNDELGTLNDSGSGAKSAIQGVMHSIAWIVAFLPVLMSLASGYAMWVWTHTGIETAMENNSYNMSGKQFRFTLIIMACSMGVLGSFMLLGMFGRIFLDLSFYATWQQLVFDFWAGIL